MVAHVLTTRIAAGALEMQLYLILAEVRNDDVARQNG